VQDLFGELQEPQVTRLSSHFLRGLHREPHRLGIHVQEVGSLYTFMCAEFADRAPTKLTRAPADALPYSRVALRGRRLRKIYTVLIHFVSEVLNFKLQVQLRPHSIIRYPGRRPAS